MNGSVGVLYIPERLIILSNSISGPFFKHANPHPIQEKSFLHTIS